jgi:hypothetical protein
MEPNTYNDPIRGWQISQAPAPRRGSPTLIGLAAFTIAAAILATLLAIVDAGGDDQAATCKVNSGTVEYGQRCLHKGKNDE